MHENLVFLGFIRVEIIIKNNACVVTAAEQWFHINKSSAPHNGHVRWEYLQAHFLGEGTDE